MGRDISSISIEFSLNNRLNLKSIKASWPIIISYLQSVLMTWASKESNTLLGINSGKQMFLRVTLEFEINSPAIVWLFICSHRFPQTLWGSDEYLMKELLDPESNNTNKGLSHLLFWIIFAVSIVYGNKSSFLCYLNYLLFLMILFLLYCFCLFCWYFLNCCLRCLSNYCCSLYYLLYWCLVLLQSHVCHFDFLYFVVILTHH